MNNELRHLRRFDGFQLDTQKKVLWFNDEPIDLALKEIEILCVLTENGNQIVTKDELLNQVWTDSFVEESNLTQHIYRLRKMFKQFGKSEKLIQTVPRRGYRFTGEFHENGNGELIIERHSISQTVIEELENSAEPNLKAFPSQSSQSKLRRFGIPIVVCLVILTAAFGFYFYNPNQPISNQPIKSIAVLPMKSHSAKTDDEELRWQITDSLITKLGGVKEISIRPTASVQRFSKSDLSIFEVGKKLGVDAVLDGRIQQEGDIIRVTLQLVTVESGEQLWSEVFDGKVDQILSLQDKISARVLESLNQNRQTKFEFTNRPTQNDDAYAAYLKGRYFARRSDEKSLRKAIEFYELGIKLDSQFSDSYAALADAQYRLFNGLYDTSPENIERAKANLQKALAINPDSANALLTIGLIQNTYDWAWQKAEETWKKALEITPQSPAARMRYGMLLTNLRRFDEAQIQIEKAIDLDPTHPGPYTNLGMVYFCKKDYSKAEEFFKKSLELDEKWIFAHWYLSRTLWMQGRKAESLKYVVSGLKLDGDEALAQQIEEISSTQTPEDVTRFLIEKWTAEKTSGRSPVLATRAIYIGDHEKSLFHLEKSFNERNPWTVALWSLPEFEPLHDEPRFREILRKMNLTQSSRKQR